MPVSQSLSTSEEFLHETRETFEAANFTVSECAGQPAFDLLVKKNFLLLIKTLLNLDSFKKHHSIDLHVTARHLSAHPLIIGQRSSHNEMKSGVIYDRYQIPAMNLHTLTNFLLQKQVPYKRATRGGIYLQISGDMMRRLREEHGISKKELANELQVSERTIHSYETGSISPRDKHEKRLLELLGDELIYHLPLFKELVKDTPAFKTTTPSNYLQQEASQYLEDKGYAVLWLQHTPFSGISKVEGAKRKSMIIGITPDLENDENKQRIHVTASVSRLAEKPWFWIVEDDSSKRLESNFPILSLSELESPQSEKLLERIMGLFSALRNYDDSLKGC